MVTCIESERDGYIDGVSVTTLQQSERARHIPMLLLTVVLRVVPLTLYTVRFAVQSTFKYFHKFSHRWQLLLTAHTFRRMSYIHLYSIPQQIIVEQRFTSNSVQLSTTRDPTSA